MDNIIIQAYANRKLSKKTVDIGNMQENKITKLIFELDEDIVALGGNVYLFVSYDGNTYPYPLTDNAVEIGRELTQRSKTPTNLVVSTSEDPKNLLNDVVWISNTLTLLADKNSINIDSINEQELPPSLQIVYDRLLNLERDLQEKKDSDYWRGVKGDKGDKGDTGEKGEQGPQGENGEQGEKGLDGVGIKSIVKTSTSGLVDTYTITFTDGSTSTFAITNGEDGKDGANGSDGKDGTNGSNGADGEDGVGIQSVAQSTTSDTDGGENIITVTLTNGQSVKFTVKNGSKGSQGPQGEQGIQGEKGEKGDTGATGPAGADGKDGSDATVTTENITKALGYMPASQEKVSKLSEEIANHVLVINKAELEAFTQEELAKKYTKGTRFIVLNDEENLVPTAISSNGAIYNGCGYMNGYRLNSSGAIVSADTAIVTGFIPYNYGEKIEISGGLNTVDNGGQYVATYDNVFELVGVNYLAPLVRDSSGSSVCTDENVHVHTIDTSKFVSTSNINMFKNAKYIRVSLNPCMGKKMSVRYID